MLVVSSMIVPFSLAFVEDDIDNVFWITVDAFIDIFFFLDLILSFNTAFYDSRCRIVTDRMKIYSRYLKGWFLVDLMSIVPFSYILNSSENYHKLFRLFRLPRLSKMIRLLKFLSQEKKMSITITKILFFFKINYGVS